jgi:hypothetical protein
MTPFLKGFHLTLNRWRPGRTADMWKIRHPLEDLDWDQPRDHQVSPPGWVPPGPRLVDDLRALQLMFQEDLPTVRLLRPTRMGISTYGIGDASGAGYGSAFVDDSSIWFCFGVWGADAEDASSNF